jgi:hypothetical protein
LNPAQEHTQNSLEFSSDEEFEIISLSPEESFVHVEPIVRIPTPMPTAFILNKINSLPQISLTTIPVSPIQRTPTPEVDFALPAPALTLAKPAILAQDVQIIIDDQHLCTSHQEPSTSFFNRCWQNFEKLESSLLKVGAAFENLINRCLPCLGNHKIRKSL